MDVSGLDRPISVRSTVVHHTSPASAPAVHSPHERNLASDLGFYRLSTVSTGHKTNNVSRKTCQTFNEHCGSGGADCVRRTCCERWCPMKIRVERDGFADAVAWAARILPQKAALAGAGRLADRRPIRTARLSCPGLTTRSPHRHSSTPPSPRPARSSCLAGCWPRSPAAWRRSRSTSPPTAPGWC